MKKIFKESLELKEKISIYTVMLGKKTSLFQLKRYISNHDSVKCVTTEFCQVTMIVNKYIIFMIFFSGKHKKVGISMDV